MSRRFLASLAILAFLAGAAAAQTLTALRETGPRANRINLVILGEGYTAAQQAQFLSDAQGQLQSILADEAWVRFAESVNGYAIFVASAESGADIPPQGMMRDTYFDATFFTSGIDRLLTIDEPKVYPLLTQFVPDYDVVIVLVNSTRYGGSGGAVAVASLHASSRDLLLHELGHSFARLLDEYIESTGGDLALFPGAPNGTKETSRDTVPWRRFILATTPLPTTTAPDENLVGLFEGVNFYPTGVYRPTFNSKMRTLNRPFGPVNVRAFATEVHRLNLNGASSPPTLTSQPASAALAPGQSATLRVQAAGTGPFSYQWAFNGVYLPGATLPDYALPPLTSAGVGTYTVEVTNAAGTTASNGAAIVLQIPPPTITAQPAGLNATLGQTVTLGVAASGQGTLTYQWRFNGADLAGATSASLQLANVQPAHAGAYTVAVRNAGGETTSQPAIVGIASAAKVAGAGLEVGTDIPHPNDNIYDQILLTGPAVTVTADPGQVTRLSFVDLDDDIVQVEFSGPGTLTLALDNRSGPAAPAKYNQPSVQYMKGHATLTLSGATENTHLSVFSVGPLTAVNQQLFQPGTDYDGVADLALISISSPTGRLGSLRTANASYTDVEGFTGVHAPGIRIGGPVHVHQIAASGTATPLLLTGSVDRINVTGGDMLQPNGRAVRIGGVTTVAMIAGTTSHDVPQPARANRARYERDGQDVTAQIVVGP